MSSSSAKIARWRSALGRSTSRPTKSRNWGSWRPPVSRWAKLPVVSTGTSQLSRAAFSRTSAGQLPMIEPGTRTSGLKVALQRPGQPGRHQRGSPSHHGLHQRWLAAREYRGHGPRAAAANAHPCTILQTDGNPVAASARIQKDTVDVGPGERYDVIWEARLPGKWLLHRHIPHHTTNDNREEQGGGGHDGHRRAPVTVLATDMSRASIQQLLLSQHR